MCRHNLSFRSLGQLRSTKCYLPNFLIVLMTLLGSVFLCFQGKFPAAWLNALPCQSLGLKLNNSQLRISVGLRLGTLLCVEHFCVCGKSVDRSGWHGLSCSRSAGRFARHSRLKQIIKDSLGTPQIHSILEPPGLSRTDFKRPDGLSLTPWIRGSSLVWDATVADGLAPSRLHGGDLYAGKAATEAEDLKAKKYEPLVRDGYYFQAVAFEIQGECGSDTLRFIRDPGRRLTDATHETRAPSFLKQRISVALQTGNAASVLGTIKPTDSLEDIFYL